MGGGKGGGSAPKAPNYENLARIDAEEQRKTAELLTGWNRPNQTDQFGNTLTWSRTPDGGWSQSVNLSPQMQNLQSQILSGYGNVLGGIGSQGAFVPPDQLQYSAFSGGPAAQSSGFGGKGGAVSTGVPSGASPSPLGGKGGVTQTGGGFTPNPQSKFGGRLWVGGTPTGATSPGEYVAAGGYGHPSGLGSPTPSGGPSGSSSMRTNISFGGGSAPKFEGIDKFSNNLGDFAQFDRSQGDRVAADVFESIMGRARPEQQREQASLDLKLRQQGLQAGTEAYDRAMRNLMTSHGDVATQAGLESTLAGYNTARDIYGAQLAGRGQQFNELLGGYNANLGRHGLLTQQQLGAADISSRNAQMSMQAQIAQAQVEAQRAQQYQAEQAQRFNQALASYQLPLQQAQGYANILGSTMPGTGFQGFGSATGYNPASMTNAAQSKYNAQMGAHNAQQNKGNSLLGAGVSLGSAALLGL